MFCTTLEISFLHCRPLKTQYWKNQRHPSTFHCSSPTRRFCRVEPYGREPLDLIIACIREDGFLVILASLHRGGSTGSCSPTSTQPPIHHATPATPDKQR